MSGIEDLYLLQISAAGLPEPQREYRIIPGKRSRADFAWPEHKLAVEIEGGTWSGGRHVRGAGYANDCRKYNLAVLHGWRVLRFTSEMVRDGEALDMLEQVMTGGYQYVMVSGNATNADDRILNLE